jgi:diaminopimelate decarboxylase
MLDEMLEKAANDFGTPLYAYDGGILRKSCAAIMSAFSEFRPHYSLKANPSPGLCGIIASAGFAAEVSSDFEAAIAVQAGFDPAEIMYDGPAKTGSEISGALLKGIRRFNFESAAELERICVAGRESGTLDDLHLCARLNPVSTTSAGEVMTGKSSRFGMDEETLFPGLQAAECFGRRVNGIHLYIGSQILDPDEIVRSFNLGLASLARMAGMGLLPEGKPAELVFGPGLGVPYSRDEHPIDVESLAGRMRQCLRETDIGSRGIEVRMEIGRALVAACGMYIVRVVESKTSRGVRYILVDGGIHHFMRYALTGARHRLRPVGREWAETGKAFITGATCTPYDVLTECETGAVEAGDLLCLMDAGAYGWSMGLANFLSRPTPPEVLLDGDSLQPLRRRSSFSDLMSLCSEVTMRSPDR